ncbi:MAG: aminomethyl-transferring glycine dehydrogenase subunit GcvPA [Pseudomonadales bacterium]|jgi:glycine dehydrogenase subunit 1|tara:strand:- start:45394 stop:46764 length:1371 start_codon:yes stop_codon:yes gene_type:complete
MPFIPHTALDEQEMLSTIGVPNIDALFDEIPLSLRAATLTEVPSGISEMALHRLMAERARLDEVELCFLGAGAYEHHIPAAVWDLVGRGEFMTAYTPYQAEASQGTLQLIYEFQTMITRLTAMDVANASVYDGATALAEAMLMAVRANKTNKSKRIVVAGNLNPNYHAVCQAIVKNQGLVLEVLDYDPKTGCLTTNLEAALEGAAALVISYPNFFGGLDDVDYLTDQAASAGVLVIGVVNPTALALIKPPGEWGVRGADIAVGEGQPLGIPLASGGPYLGFMCCRQQFVRQMPGRIIGKTVDQTGQPGYTLTLQAREQHIRRGKATSNICTNQGLLVTAATIYMSLLGNEGMRQVALASHAGINVLTEAACQIEGVTARFSGPVFHERVLSLPVDASRVVDKMAEQGVLPGLALGTWGEALNHCLLVNVTETKTPADIDRFASLLAEVIEEVRATC